MRRPDFSRRVAVTGLGIISPVGNDISTAWTNLVEGNTGLKRITRWDPEITTCHAAGEVNDFEPKDWMNFKAIRRTDKNVVFGVASATQALADSGLEVDEDNSEDNPLSSSLSIIGIVMVYHSVASHYNMPTAK